MAERPSFIREQELAERRRAVLLRVVRVAFIVLFSTVTLLNILSPPEQRSDGSINRTLFWPLTLAVAVGLAAVVILVDIFTPRKKISTLFSVFLGLLGAMIASLAVSAVIDLLAKSYDITDQGLLALVKVLVGIALAYLAITTVLQTQDDFRLVIPYVEFVKQTRGPRPMLMDSSAIIDGRFLDLADSGLVSAPVVIPRFVIEELHALADSQDKLKRAKGRRGLANVERLQSSTAADVSIEGPGPLTQPADLMLLELARTMSGLIVTTDSGLAKVAAIQGVDALNLHAIASALRPTVAAGDPVTVRIVRPGEHPGQGVGYLDDGTMVVVDNAGGLTGLDTSAVVTSMIQTSAGRMVFARLAGHSPAATPTTPPPPPSAPIPGAADPAPHPAPTPHASAEPTAPAPTPESIAFTESQPIISLDPAKGPFPPNPPRSIRTGSPRNPRR
ncbi:MAG: PIN/TRAM domain-containing protein [Phycisphaeraceae bacterium]|nr:MAG: PIN/TRAM domain-containing protein [Phycisphaeraceae bacterium]